MANAASPLKGDARAPHRRTLLLAVATLSLLAAFVLVASIAKAPAIAILEEEGIENESPMPVEAPEEAKEEEEPLLEPETEDKPEDEDESEPEEEPVPEPEGEEQVPEPEDEQEEPEPEEKEEDPTLEMGDGEDEDEDVEKEMNEEAEPEEEGLDEDEAPKEEEEEEVPLEDDIEKADAEPEAVEDKEHHHIFAKLAHYASLHPVFKRCISRAQMHAFSHEIMKTCGNIHELDTCAYPCWRAMTMYTDHVGCCWETVMEGYKHLDWYAYHAWRHWQGTLSGKCGITFENDQCGESVGAKPWHDLKDKVEQMKRTAEENEDAIHEIKYPANYYSDGYYYYGDQDKDWGPTHYKQQDARQQAAQRHHVKRSKHTLLTEKEKEEDSEPLGDEVFDMPIGGGEDMGDVHVPSDKLRPYMFINHREPAAKEEEGADKEEPAEEEEEYEDDGSHKKGRVEMRQRPPRQQLAGDAYDSFRNYQNELRLREAYDKIKEDPSRANKFFQPPGEAWHSFAPPADEAARAMPQSLHAREEEGEQGKPFDLAHGVVEGGFGSTLFGIGKAGHAGGDPFTGRPMVERDPMRRGLNRLTPDAAVRQAAFNRGEFGPDADAGSLPGGYAMAGVPPQTDRATAKLRKAGVNV